MATEGGGAGAQGGDGDQRGAGGGALEHEEFAGWGEWLIHHQMAQNRAAAPASTARALESPVRLQADGWTRSAAPPQQPPQGPLLDQGRPDRGELEPADPGAERRQPPGFRFSGREWLDGPGQQGRPGLFPHLGAPQVELPPLDPNASPEVLAAFQLAAGSAQGAGVAAPATGERRMVPSDPPPGASPAVGHGPGELEEGMPQFMVDAEWRMRRALLEPYGLEPEPPDPRTAARWEEQRSVGYLLEREPAGPPPAPPGQPQRPRPAAPKLDPWEMAAAGTLPPKQPPDVDLDVATPRAVQGAKPPPPPMYGPIAPRPQAAAPPLDSPPARQGPETKALPAQPKPRPPEPAAGLPQPQEPWLDAPGLAKALAAKPKAPSPKLDAPAQAKAPEVKQPPFLESPPKATPAAPKAASPEVKQPPLLESPPKATPAAPKAAGPEVKAIPWASKLGDNRLLARPGRQPQRGGHARAQQPPQPTPQRADSPEVEVVAGPSLERAWGATESDAAALTVRRQHAAALARAEAAALPGPAEAAQGPAAAGPGADPQGSPADSPGSLGGAWQQLERDHPEVLTEAARTWTGAGRPRPPPWAMAREEALRPVPAVAPLQRADRPCAGCARTDAVRVWGANPLCRVCITIRNLETNWRRLGSRIPMSDAYRLTETLEDVNLWCTGVGLGWTIEQIRQEIAELEPVRRAQFEQFAGMGPPEDPVAAEAAQPGQDQNEATPGQDQAAEPELDQAEDQAEPVEVAARVLPEEPAWDGMD